MKRALTLPAVMLWLGLASTAWSLNLGPLLVDTPAEFFNEQDYALFDAALMKALKELPSDVSAPWDNPQTGASGSSTVLRVYEHDGHACKRVRIDNRARNRTGSTVFDFCQQPDGRWTLAPPNR
jgi:surface antigen